MYNRAKDENKSPYEMLTTIVAELRKIRQAIHAALESNPAALERWMTWERGYVYVGPLALQITRLMKSSTSEWHLISERYRLKELCL